MTQRAANLQRENRSLVARLADAKDELATEEERRQRAERSCKDMQSELDSLRTDTSLMDQSGISAGLYKRREENVKQMQVGLGSVVIGCGLH
jgi:hypothetical protein